MLCDLLEGKELFSSAFSHISMDGVNHGSYLAHMTALLGPAPTELLVRDTATECYYTHDCMYV
jgi:hypothetical protein